MNDTPDPRKLKELEDRLAEARAAQEDPRPQGRHVHGDTGVAWRMVVELVTGMGVGFGIGYGLDVFFGTLPIFLVLFCLLGFAAGVRVMIQTAREVQMKDQGHAPDENGT